MQPLRWRRISSGTDVLSHALALPPRPPPLRDLRSALASGGVSPAFESPKNFTRNQPTHPRLKGPLPAHRPFILLFLLLYRRDSSVPVKHDIRARKSSPADSLDRHSPPDKTLHPRPLQLLDLLEATSDKDRRDACGCPREAGVAAAGG